MEKGLQSTVMKYANCESCPLNKGQPVHGYGNSKSPDYMFIGESPGEQEEEQRKPFVGKSGQFLMKCLKSLGIDPKQAYFTNTTLCRAPAKGPNSKSIAACNKRLLAEIIRVNPKLIITLGTVATRAVGPTKLPITRSHGMYVTKEITTRTKKYSYGVVPTYHPAYLLRGGKAGGAEAFRDFNEEMNYAMSIIAGEPAIIPIPYDAYHHVMTQDQFDYFLENLEQVNLASCDIETDTMNFFKARILCVGFSWKRGTAWVVDGDLLEHHYENKMRLKETLKHIKLIYQNGLYDVPFMLHNGMLTDILENENGYYLDSMLAHYLLDERQYTHGLERLAIKWYRAPAYKQAFRESIGVRGYKSDEEFAPLISNAPKKDLFNYNGADADFTFRLGVDLTREVKADNQLMVLKDIEMPSAREFTNFYMKGLLIDRKYMETVGKAWLREYREYKNQMLAIVLAFANYPPKEYLAKYGRKWIDQWLQPPGFNLQSTHQLAHFLYDCLGLVPFGGESSIGSTRIDADVISQFIQSVEDKEAREYWIAKRTSMNQGADGTLKGISSRTTQTYVLYWLRQQGNGKFADILIKWRHIRKRVQMYYIALKKDMYEDGRIRPQYDMTSSRTGRKNTRHPQVHNLPRGDVVYNMVIPDPGWCLIHADYAQAEMRMMAHYSGDDDLIHVLETQDIHTVMVKEMFGLTDDDIAKMPKDVLSDKRISAKMITFGLPYGRSAAGLAPQLGVSKEEAQGYIDSYFAKFPILKKWIDAQRARGVKEQVITSVFNRRRRFPLITDKAHRKEVERQAGNMAIQSAINDLTLLAYVHSINTIRKMGIPCNPGAHIHDSINLSVPIPFWVEAVNVVREQMNIPQFPSKVKFPAEVEVGDRWGHMITVITKKNTWAVLDPDDNTIMDWLRRTIPTENKTPVQLELLPEPITPVFHHNLSRRHRDMGGRNI